MGAGRCAEPCRPGPAPPVPESCQEPACHGNTSGWKDEPWCNTIDDTWNPHMHSRGWTPEDGFGPWGSCTDRKNLPHSGFEYDRDSLLATLGMSLPRLLQEYPGCGKVPIVFAKNRAGGNGGGLYKSSCSLQPDLKHVCFLSGMSGAVVVSFEENMAGAAGGGAYIACDKLGECDNHVHIPEIGGQSLHFEGNEAGTFGADVGSGPRELLLSKAVREYVPGQSILSLSFELRDALGQTVRSTSDAVLPFLVSFSVCAPEGACDSGSALQAIGYMSLRAGGAEGSTEDSKTILQYCVLGEESVRVRVELLGDESEDAGLTSKEIEVQCLPCDPLQKMVTVELGGRRLWTCQSCDAGEYVLNLGGNDPEAQCHNCPVGAGELCLPSVFPTVACFWRLRSLCFLAQLCSRGFLVSSDRTFWSPRLKTTCMCLTRRAFAQSVSMASFAGECQARRGKSMRRRGRSSSRPVRPGTSSPTVSMAIEPALSRMTPSSADGAVQTSTF
eukprot:249114-Rhodomonas_salina.1